jgi:hypothetical protein
LVPTGEEGPGQGQMAERRFAFRVSCHAMADSAARPAYPRSGTIAEQGCLETPSPNMETGPPRRCNAAISAGLGGEPAGRATVLTRQGPRLDIGARQYGAPSRDMEKAP